MTRQSDRITDKQRLARFRTLRRHVDRVEEALLNSMIDVYGSEAKANTVAAMPEYQRFALADLLNEKRKAFEAAVPILSRRKRSRK